MNISVLGAGHGGHAMSADLALAGHNVNLFEFKRFEENLQPIRENEGIEIIGASAGRSGLAKLNKVTTDMKDAIDETKLVMVVVPGYAREAIFEDLRRYLVDNQVVVLWPGYWSSMLLSGAIKKTHRKVKPVISEATSLMYACRRVAPAKVWVRRIKETMPVAAFPATNTPKAVETLREVYPQVEPARNVIETSLNNQNPSGHVPGMILNAARIESTKGDFNFFQEAQLNPVPCIKNVKAALETERHQLCKRLGVRTDLAEKFYIPGKMASTPDASKVSMTELPFVAQATPDRAPNTLQFRYLTEDVPYGLVPSLSLGEQVGVEMPNTRALVQLASIINEVDYFKQGLTADKLGLAGLNVSQIKKRL